MEYYRYNSEGFYIGVTGTQPNDDLWTYTPYVNSFIAPKWNGEKWIESGVFDANVFKSQLSDAFDAKFETYWKAKGYTDMFDLLSHAANPESIYNSEALSLLQWSQVNWEVAITGINEQSNIETIIKNLQPHNN